MRIFSHVVPTEGLMVVVGGLVVVLSYKKELI